MHPSFRDVRCWGDKSVAFNSWVVRGSDPVFPTQARLWTVPAPSMASVSVDQDNSSTWPSAIPVVVVVGVPSKSVPGKHV